MNAHQYQEKYGREAMKSVCVQAGFKPSYAYHLVTRRRIPSIDAARKLVAASHNQLTVIELLDVERHKPEPRQEVATHAETNAQDATPENSRTADQGTGFNC